MEIFQQIFNLETFSSTLRMAIPLMVAAIGGMFSERSGVVNIALEGMMLAGAFIAVVVSYFTGSAWLGLLGAVFFGGVFALIHALVSIRYHADQVVSGVALNLLAAGGTVFLLNILFNTSGTSPSVTALPYWGPFKPTVYLGLLIVLISHYILFFTPFGLRVRAVGEHPHAADSVGIDVEKIRYVCVILSGMLAGFAGAHLSIGVLSVFREGMTAGRGFIALAALIFGKWYPFGAMGASLLFGFFQAIEIRLQGIEAIGIPAEFIQMIPYILTVIALAGVIGRATPPAASGEPFEKGKR
ncbi:nucleoside ABC transporter membrane protein [Orenia metallireducens]|jgi:simple sugar transport system permease protein|uniref:Nucleoside ABC transporter membrane protein n=1 Tax=Orenia metallireducens TaxID=1413210 RepID=A0A285FIQ0_9FIRM|nr:ABC transporter permease [Orenia metallireducens]PRX33572.1 nucleoside ABC transporter membrane protein [Orenia metallireducens]SNY11098.1 nucleoside ABC transporter membrane protein [Orenia metallireducens]